jgi:hypothetical protein
VVTESVRELGVETVVPVIAVCIGALQIFVFPFGIVVLIVAYTWR